MYTPHPHKPVNINKVHKQERAGLNDKVAVAITRGFGTMWAFYALVVWMFGWMTLAGLDVWLFANDKYPYAFLLFLSNLVQLFALPILSVGQNVFSRKQELQINEEYERVEKIYADVETLIKQNNDIIVLLQGKQVSE